MKKVFEELVSLPILAQYNIAPHKMVNPVATRMLNV